MVNDEQCEEEAESDGVESGRKERRTRWEREKNQVGKRGWREVAGNGMERCAKHTTHSLVLSHTSSFLLLLPPSLTLSLTCCITFGGRTLKKGSWLHTNILLSLRSRPGWGHQKFIFTFKNQVSS